MRGADTGRPAAMALRLRQSSRPGAGAGDGRGEIAAGEASLWRYRAALALRDPPRVSLGEGWTPLVERHWDGAPVLFKLESQMPTGSFKDRGTAVMLNHLIEVGVGPIHEDSSGNAGSSIATYAAAAGLRCRIYVPATAPRGKIVQIAASGAEVRAIPGTRQEVTEAALAASARASMPATTGSPSLSRAPRRWPTNSGSSSASACRTTSSCRPATAATSSGWTAVSTNSNATARSVAGPRLFAVQAANCAAFAAAWNAGADDYVPFAPAPTAADGIATVKPVRTARSAARIAPFRRRRGRGAGSRDRAGAGRRSAGSACLSSRPPPPPRPPSRTAARRRDPARTRRPSSC